MATNITNLVKGRLGSSAVSQAAIQLGESESGVSKAIAAFIPIVVGAFTHCNTPSELFATVKETQFSQPISELLEKLNDSDSANSKMLSLLFGEGDLLAAITTEVSAYAGVKAESAKSLLSLVTEATAETINKYLADHHLELSSFSNFLNDQKGFLASSLPPGFSFASLGLGNWLGSSEVETANVVPEPLQTPLGNINPTTENPVKTENPEITEAEKPVIEVTRSGTTHDIVPDKSGSTGNIWKWLLPLLLLLILGWFFWKQCDTGTTVSIKENSAEVSNFSQG